jgi:hypothetical protein
MKMSRIEAGKLGYAKTHELHQKRYKELRQRYEENPRRCKQCNGKIPYAKRYNTFCGSSCSASFNNIGICRHVALEGGEVREPKLKQERFCKNCNCHIHGSKKKYCSLACHREMRWKIRKEKIEQCSAEKAPRVAKRYLIEIRGHRCEVCHNIEWNNQAIPLILDHIDGHSENNKLTNLRLVCGNCDMQLPTYKNKNKGNGRASRRQRYTLGKSY